MIRRLIYCGLFVGSSVAWAAKPKVKTPPKVSHETTKLSVSEELAPPIEPILNSTEIWTKVLETQDCSLVIRYRNKSLAHKIPLSTKTFKPNGQLKIMQLETSDVAGMYVRSRYYLLSAKNFDAKNGTFSFEAENFNRLQKSGWFIEPIDAIRIEGAKLNFDKVPLNGTIFDQLDTAPLAADTRFVTITCEPKKDKSPNH